MEKVLYVIAMEKEAKNIVEKLRLNKMENKEFNLYGKDNIRLLITGIGKQRVAIILSKYMEVYKNEKPDLIVNLGYAGSTNSKIGTWVNVNNVYNYEWEIPGEEKYTLNGYSNTDIIVKIKDKDIEELPCYTAEKFVTTTNIKENIVFDMELHSIYLICCIYNIKLLALKKVSDNLNLKDYYSNIDIKDVMELTSGLKYCN